MRNRNEIKDTDGDIRVRWRKVRRFGRGEGGTAGETTGTTHSEEVVDVEELMAISGSKES